MLANLSHPNALNARMRALEHHVEKIGGESRVFETRRLAQTYYALVLALLVLLDHPAGGMVGVGQFGEGVAEGGSTLFHRHQFLGYEEAPILDLALRVVAVHGVVNIPFIT